MDKVYIVFIECGYEMIISVDKVFINKQNADEYAKSINDKFTELKSKLPIDKTQNDDFLNNFDMNKYDEYMDELVKEINEFKNKYNISSYEVGEFNKAEVCEYKVN